MKHFRVSIIVAFVCLAAAGYWGYIHTGISGANPGDPVSSATRRLNEELTQPFEASSEDPLKLQLSLRRSARSLAPPWLSGSTLTVNADELRNRARNTSLPSASSSPGASRVGAQMRAPLT